MSPNGLISVSSLIEQLRGEGLSASEDSLQRLRDNELIGNSKRLGRGFGSAYRSPQAQRIRTVLRIQHDLGAKWSYPELAFWMAAHKMHDVPVNLVAEHIQSSIELFVKIVTHLTDRSARGRGKPDESPARKMARRAAQQLIHVREAASQEAAALAEGLLELCLSLWYFNVPPSEVNRILRRIIYEVYDASVADKEFIVWQERISDHATLFSSDFRANRLVADVAKALNKEPLFITLAARDGLQGYMLIKGGLDEVPDVQLRVASSTAYFYTRLARVLVPMLSAVSIDVQLDNSSNQILLQMRAGDDLGIRAFVRNRYR